MTRKVVLCKTSTIKWKSAVVLVLLSATLVLWVIWIEPEESTIVDPMSGGIVDGLWSGNVSLVIVSPERLFTNGQARKIAFLQRGTPVATAKKKLIFLATNFHKMAWPDHFYYLQSGSSSFQDYHCPYSNCLVTRDQARFSESDAVIFHLRDLDISLWPDLRSPRQKWILYTMEPPWLDLIDVGKLDGYFNWTMSYREDSDVVVRYGFVADREPPLGTDPSLRQRPKKDKFAVWFVSDCCTESRREQFVTELRKYIIVDVFGGCGLQQCQPAESKECYDLLNSYRFYLSFENAICKDYVTEKFFNVLEHDVIPVVMGGANYSSVAPPGSYVDALRFRSPRHLAEYLKTLAADEDKYWKFFDWKRRLKSYLPAWPCDLCAKLNTDSEATTVRTGLHKWWNADALCKSWTTRGLRTGLSPIIPCYRRQIFI